MSEERFIFPAPCREQWSAMTPNAQGRFCSRCATTVHDLSKLSAAETAALIDSGQPICAKARLDRNGHALVGGEGGRKTRLFPAAIGAALALALSSSAALAKERRPEGAIAGRVEYGSSTSTVTAIGADGVRHTAKVGRYGKYKIKHLPPGVYQIEFFESDENRWSGGQIVVADRKSTICNTINPNPPIIVGLVEIDRNEG